MPLNPVQQKIIDPKDVDCPTCLTRAGTPHCFVTGSASLRVNKIEKYCVERLERAALLSQDNNLKMNPITRMYPGEVSNLMKLARR